MMILNDNVIWHRLKYAVLSVTRTTSPYPADNTPWYKYIVGRSNTCLVCKARGTLEEVTQHAEQLAVDLNSRRNLRLGIYRRFNQKYITHKKKVNA